MKISSNNEFGKIPKKIIEFLLENPYIQKNLQEKLNMSAPGLLYHLDILEKAHFIQKKTLYQVGYSKINEISINPLQIQTIRAKLGKKIQNCTLLTGFGEEGYGYRIPDISFSLVHHIHYKVDNIVCITTQNGKKKREEKSKTENLKPIKKYYSNFTYNDFKRIDSSFFQELDNILKIEISESNLIVDITPLSKLYSFEILKRANLFNLASFYLGQNLKGEDSLIWMTDIQVAGTYN